MTIQGNPRQSAPLNEALGNAMRHGADLVKSEIALARAELAANIRHVAGGLAMFVLAAAFLIIALGLAVEALVAWLTPILGSQATAAIVCAGGAAAIAIALGAAGLSRVHAGALYPDRTAASVERDARMIQRRVS